MYWICIFRKRSFSFLLDAVVAEQIFRAHSVGIRVYHNSSSLYFYNMMLYLIGCYMNSRPWLKLNINLVMVICFCYLIAWCLAVTLWVLIMIDFARWWRLIELFISLLIVYAYCCQCAVRTRTNCCCSSFWF